jgi:hypothetical protein
MHNRLIQALVAYTALSVLAYFMLTGTARLAILILFGYFAVRTVLAHFKPKDED